MAHGLVIGPVAQSTLQEDLLPGHASLRAGLHIQGLGVVQTHGTGVHGVLIQKIVDLHPVVGLQLGVGQLGLAHGGDDGITIEILGLGGVAALAGHIVGVAVGGDGHGDRLLGDRLAGHRRSGGPGRSGFGGSGAALAAQDQGRNHRNGRHSQDHQQGDLAGAQAGLDGSLLHSGSLGHRLSVFSTAVGAEGHALLQLGLTVFAIHVLSSFLRIPGFVPG